MELLGYVIMLMICFVMYTTIASIISIGIYYINRKSSNITTNIILGLTIGILAIMLCILANYFSQGMFYSGNSYYNYCDNWCEIKKYACVLFAKLSVILFVSFLIAKIILLVNNLINGFNWYSIIDLLLTIPIALILFHLAQFL